MRNLTLFTLFITALLQSACNSGDTSGGYDSDQIDRFGLTACFDAYEKAYAVHFSSRSPGDDDRFFIRAWHEGEWTTTADRKVELSEEDVSAILEIVGSPEFESDNSSKCVFMPGHSVVFFGKDGEYLGEISICFRCNQFRTPSGSDEQDMSRESSDALKDFFVSKGFDDPEP
jgi:hypothetical protein